MSPALIHLLTKRILNVYFGPCQVLFKDRRGSLRIYTRVYMHYTYIHVLHRKLPAGDCAKEENKACYRDSDGAEVSLRGDLSGV